MSKYDGLNVYPFDNEVVEIKFENQLNTKMDMMQFANADYSLSENAGMKKKIRKYSGTGAVEELAMGVGNSGTIGAGFTEVEYEVGTTQGKGQYYDEQLMDDPAVIDKLVQHMSELMVNDMNSKIVAELGKTTNKLFGVTVGFDAISDGIAAFPKEETEGEALFILINRKDSSAWRKALGDDLKYVEAFVRRGYIGTVCGVPIFWNDVVPQGKTFLATREAVTVFVKKGVEVERDREPNLRRNDLYIRKVMLVALTNADKCIELTTDADPRTGYTVLTEAPLDWATDYNDYYTFDVVNEEMVKNDFDAAPTFVAGQFWSKD